jgi:hypothetical protein
MGAERPVRCSAPTGSDLVNGTGPANQALMKPAADPEARSAELREPSRVDVVEEPANAEPRQVRP